MQDEIDDLPNISKALVINEKNSSEYFSVVDLPVGQSEFTCTSCSYHATDVSAII